MSSIDDSQSSSAKKRRRNAIWDMYEKEEDSHGEIKWKCSECQERLSNHPTSVTRHWELKHKEKQQPAKKMRSQISENTVTLNSRDSRVQRAFVDVLSIPCMSVNLMLHPLVRKLFYEMNPKIEFPSSFNTLKSMLTNQLERVEQSLKADLKNTAHRFSLTCDVWSDKGLNSAYLGVTLHYCNESAVLKRVFLGLCKLSSPHTGVSIRLQTEKILEKYRISLRRVFKVVTDGGSNMVKAFKDMVSVDVCLQWLSEQEESDNDDNDIHLEDLERELELSIQSAFPLRIGCFAHALQLVIMSMFKDCVGTHAAYIALSRLIGKFQHSTSAKEELKNMCGKGLISPSKTRWAAQIVVLKQFLEIQEFVSQVAQVRKWEYLTESEIEVLRDLYALMKIFVDVLCRVQSEKNVSISRCYGYLKAIYKSVDRFQSTRSQPEIAIKLKNLMDTRFDWMMNSESINFDPIFFIAAALDPNTANILNASDYKITLNEIQNLIGFGFLPRQEERCTQSRLNSTLDQLLGEVLAENKTALQAQSNVSPNSLLLQVMSQVLSASASGHNSIDAMKYWTSLLNSDANPIAVFALEVLSIPATSAPVERIFSQAGMATATHRNKTSFELLNAQLVVYCNRFCDGV